MRIQQKKPLELIHSDVCGNMSVMKSSGYEVKTIQSDISGEYISKEFDGYLKNRKEFGMN